MVQEWLNNQREEVWQRAIPANSRLNAEEYKRIWKKLNGVQ